jgi:hypothetical protein
LAAQERLKKENHIRELAVRAEGCNKKQLAAQKKTTYHKRDRQNQIKGP